MALSHLHCLSPTVVYQELKHTLEDIFKSLGLFAAAFSSGPSLTARPGPWTPVLLGEIHPTEVSDVYNSLLKVRAVLLPVNTLTRAVETSG